MKQQINFYQHEINNNLDLHRVLVDHLQKTKKECKNLKKQEVYNIFINKLDKACFQHDMAYENYKDLSRRTDSDKIFYDKAFSVGKNPKND